MACVTTTFQIQTLCTSISSVYKIGPKSGKILGQSQKHGLGLERLMKAFLKKLAAIGTDFVHCVLLLKRFRK